MRLLHDDETDPQTKEEIRAWFWSEVSLDAKDAAMAEQIRSMLWNTAPNEYDRQKFAELTARIGGMAPVRRLTLRRRLTRVAIGFAAVMIPVALLVGTYLWFNAPGPTLMPAAQVLVSAATDMQKHLILPDSSEVWLNEKSTLTYPNDFTANRTVELDGEAYFHVRKAGGAAFTVNAGELTATVLGTEFNVKAYSGQPQTEITLDTGSIEVSTPGQICLMKPNERLIMDRSSGRIRIEENVNESSWRTGMEFYANPLKDILSTVASRFNLRIEIDGELPPDQIRFGFDYDASPELILSVLESAHPHFTYELKGDSLLITVNR
jgi:anti-sigma factor